MLNTNPKLTVIAAIDQTFTAFNNCVKSGNALWQGIHWKHLTELVKEFMPSGGGFDCGTEILSKIDKAVNSLTFRTAYHHMNENGFYDGWTSHDVKILPRFDGGFDMKISGRDRNEIKDCIYEVFDCACRQLVQFDESVDRYTLAK